MSENGNGKKELVEIFVDGQPVKVLPGINAIEAAKVAGKEIPHYCYHPKLPVHAPPATRNAPAAPPPPRQWD
mgnify:CR=1 FL=1